MQSKDLALFTPFLANVAFTLPEPCALKTYENQGMKRSIGRKQARKKRKTEYNI